MEWKTLYKNSRSTTMTYLPGLLLVGFISLISYTLNEVIEDYVQLEAVTIAILISILYSHAIKIHDFTKPGITFSLKKLLKVGIILLGFKLNLQTLKTLIDVGPTLLMIILFYVPTTLGLSIVLGKWLNVDTKLSTLLGVGSSICGASAIVALAPTINAKKTDSVIAVSAVSLLGAVGVFIYIAISNTNIDAIQYGAWSGLTLHGVAHAVAAASANGYDSEVVGTAVKLTRVLMLIPVSLLLGYVFNKESEDSKGKVANFPMYVLYFIVAVGINSTGILPDSITDFLSFLSKAFILMAMAAMGLNVSFRGIANKSLKAILHGGILFAIMSTIGFFLLFYLV